MIKIQETVNIFFLIDSETKLGPPIKYKAVDNLLHKIQFDN